MSRSNPSDTTPNPSQRWHEWDGENGQVRYFDKEAKSLKDPTKKGQNIICPLPFTFIVLDETATVKGWHEASESGIYSNEVRDTRADVLVVKAFKGGILAEGLYANIRDRVAAMDGYFVTNIYIGYKDAAGQLQIGALQFKGASLNNWVEFKNKHRAEIYKKAVNIVSFTQHKKGKIDYRKPVFSINAISDKTDAEAKALDMLLQQYLNGYFSRTKSQQVAQPPATDAAIQPDARDSGVQDSPSESQIQEPPICSQCQTPLDAEGNCPQCSDVPF